MLSIHDLPMFFNDEHRALAQDLEGWVAEVSQVHDAAAVAARMGQVGLYGLLVPEGNMDVRRLCLAREALGYHHAMADAIFAVQGLSCEPLRMAGSPEQREVLKAAALGEKIGGFALTEPEAGSDVAAMQCTARAEGEFWVLNGEKTLISNVGIAHYYVVFANADPTAGRKGISAFFVAADSPGLRQTAIPLTVDHPLGSLTFSECRIPKTALVGKVGDGLKLALGTLGTYRVSVAAAAVGMARRAIHESLNRVKQRVQFGGPLAEKPLVRAKLAEMATELDAARLLVYRAAWEKDAGQRAAKEVAMAKWYATEAAFRIIDQAVQLHGGLGVTLGSTVERLLREVRPLRIYEGTSEIQQLIIGEEVLRG